MFCVYDIKVSVKREHQWPLLLTLILVWIRKCIHYKVWDESTYHTLLGMWLLTMYPCWQKGAPARNELLLSLTPADTYWYLYIEGILPKGSYLPCVSMAGRALLAGYHRYMDIYFLDIPGSCVTVVQFNNLWIHIYEIYSHPAVSSYVFNVFSILSDFVWASSLLIVDITFVMKNLFKRVV